MNNFGQLYGRSMAAMAVLCPAWAGGFEALPRHRDTSRLGVVRRRRKDGINVTPPGKRGRVDRTGSSQRRDVAATARGANCTRENK